MGRESGRNTSTLLIAMIQNKLISPDHSSYMKESTKMIKNMEKEYLPGLVEIHTKENIKMTREKGMER